MLVAHCKALEARGPIASHSAGPPRTSILTGTGTIDSGSMSIREGSGSEHARLYRPDRHQRVGSDLIALAEPPQGLSPHRAGGRDLSCRTWMRHL